MKLINKIFEYKYFPKQWKIATVVPIPKPGSDPHLAKNYRPISLLSSLSKLIEHVICTRLTSFLNTHNIINNSQFGFRAQHSTTHQLLRVVELIYDGFENCMHTGAVFFDIEKVFDKAWHSGLNYKLIKYKLPTVMILLIHSNLLDRSFAVRHTQAG